METAIQVMARICCWAVTLFVICVVAWALFGDVGSPRMQSRGSGWQRVRAAHLEKHPACEACGSIEALNVHHIQTVMERPDLELEPSNLLTLCREHHFRIGHDPDGIDGPLRPNWSRVNPRARQDAAKWKARFSK